MTQTTVDLALGLDPSTKIIGFAFVDMADGAIKWHGILKINEPDKGWRDQQISKQLRILKETLDARSEKDGVTYRLKVVGIERMFLGINAKTALELSYCAGAVHQATRHSFPNIEILRFLPPDWREKCGLERSASKAALTERATELGAEPDTPQDEVDSILIAIAARGSHRAQAPATRPRTKPKPKPKPKPQGDRTRVVRAKRA
jgi:Holliday junction resolvasome RuvABC endonuclease subunit